eukprot:m.207474 g.207474  ORF g.207474 m.207474 type:complete len:136 (+) comp39694_c1_seq52:832-1239(+)
MGVFSCSFILNFGESMSLTVEIILALITENQDRLGAFMENRGAQVPGLLTLTMSLSLPFRRLEKYPSTLLELHRQIGDKHSDYADCLKASETFDKLKGRVQLVRKRKEMEQDMLSETIEGWTGPPVSELVISCYL